MKDRYVSCYVSGRMDHFDGTVDIDKLVARIGAGAPVRETTIDVARKALAPEMDASSKVQWLQDNIEEIRAMGGDTEKAWRLFSQGRVDALASQLEEEAMEELVNQLEDEGDEEDHDDSEDSDDAEDPDDEESEDEDEEEED